jgi:hypothetical protein
VLPAVSLSFASVAATVLIAGAPASSTPPRAYEAPCPSGVSGGLPADYERWSLLAGPLALYPVRADYPRYPARFIASIRDNLRRDLRSFAGRRLTRRERSARARTRSAPRRASDHRYPAFEAAAAIQAGHTVTLAVAPPDRAHVGFLFDHRAFRHGVHGYAVADGTAAVTFRGCTFPSTQYQGGFVADGPRCATLEAWVDGATVPERRVVSFGSGDCGAPEQTRPGGPPPPPLTLGPRPRVVERACHRRRLSWCPATWPLRPASRPQGGRDYADGPARLLSFSDFAVEGEGGHLLLGERFARYDLRGRPGAPFLRPGRDPLRIPSRRRSVRNPGHGRFVTESPARILRRTTVRGHPALVLAAPPYPRGGLHGGHAIVVWNEGGRGRLVSLHFRDALDRGRYDRGDRVAAALAVARS